MPTNWKEECRRLRARMHLSQARAAALVGVAPNTWWRWESGRRKPRGIGTVARLTELLDSPDDSLESATTEETKT